MNHDFENIKKNKLADLLRYFHSELRVLKKENIIQSPVLSVSVLLCIDTSNQRECLASLLTSNFIMLTNF